MTHREHVLSPNRTCAGFDNPFLSSGPSPTVHLVGVGQVGQAFLRLLAAGAPLRLLAATDSSGTVHARGGLDAAAIAAHKAGGGRIADLDGAASLPASVAVGVVGADVVVDAAATRLDNPQQAVARVTAALATGAHAVLACKDALAFGWPRWNCELRARVHADAALGGTGARLLSECGDLRTATDEVVLVGNATTSVVVGELEAGRSLAQALDRARRRGLLEADPVADLGGEDLWVKAAAVAAILWGDRHPAPAGEALAFPEPDLLALRRARGNTTRQVARVRCGHAPRLAWEELPAHSPLAVPGDRVAYGYRRRDGVLRLHVGTGVGAEPTAAAVLGDALRARRALCLPDVARRAGGAA